MSPLITLRQGRPGLDDVHVRRRRRSVPQLYIDPEQDRQLAELAGDAERAGRACSSPWADESTGQTVGDEPSYTIGPPNNFNMDSMGYNADVIAQEPETVDWPELFNAELPGAASRS